MEQSGRSINELIRGSERGKYFHSQFRGTWERAIRFSGEELAKETVRLSYHKDASVLLYTDLKKVLAQMNLHPQDAEACEKDFSEFIKSMTVFKMEEEPASNTWYNSTINGINLRPGKTLTSGKLPPAVTMSGQTSHAIVGGRTGSGKSVFLNNLILNLMIEYAPWELEIYLADFKKVEMSRYMNKYPAPHVRACAATSEIGYVLSLIQYIKEKKDERETLFSRLNVVNIEAFRQKYKMVAMPRILFLVDEFQQLFLDATSKQKDQIDDLITDITRKGRAVGVHLLFASQDMSGALTEKQMTNFKIRFALACDSSVSSQILGNTGATTLKTGQVICNTTSKNEEDNITYDVPFVEDTVDLDDENENQNTKEPYLYQILKEQEKYADQLGFEYKDSQKFYNEDQQWEIEELEKLLNNPIISNARAGLKKTYFTSLFLGKKVVHTNQKYDIFNCHIEKGKNHSILGVSGNIEDIAYLEKLLAVNFGTLAYRDSIEHTVFEFNPIISTLYRHDAFEKDLGISGSDREVIYRYNMDDMGVYAYQKYKDRKKLLDALQNVDECPNVREFVKYILTDMLNEEDNNQEDIERTIDYYMNEVFSDLPDNDNPFGIMRYINDPECIMPYAFKAYYKYRIEKRDVADLFPKSVLWFVGIENVDRLPRWFDELASKCMDVNILCIFLSATVVDSDIYTACNYIFVAGGDSKLYDKYYGGNVLANANSIKVYCNVKNRNEYVAFKKYKCMFNDIEANFFDIDELMNHALLY